MHFTFQSWASYPTRTIRDNVKSRWTVKAGVHGASRFRRYYFVVEEDNTPLSVTVTPCDAPLEWKLTLQELPEDASGEGSGTAAGEFNDTFRGNILIPHTQPSCVVMLALCFRWVLIKSQSCLV